jgi:L-ascorbate metabolism protein UlaG (beta-lactamase superfamily)
MIRFVASLVGVLSLTAAVPAADQPVVLRWHGQSFFEVISPAGVRVAIDPHAIEAYGRKQVEADLVLMSHLHSDHTQLSAIANAAKTKVLPGLKEVRTEGGRHEEWINVHETLRDVKVRSVPTYHDKRAGLERGKNTVFVLEIAGLTIVHLGDLGHTLTETQLKRIGPVDVLLIPVGGVYTINGLDAQAVVEQLRPARYVLPMHYGTIVYDYLLDLDKSLFLDEIKPERIKKLTSNELRIDPKEKPPAEPLIVIPHWEKRAEK